MVGVDHREPTPARGLGCAHPRACRGALEDSEDGTVADEQAHTWKRGRIEEGEPRAGRRRRPPARASQDGGVSAEAPDASCGLGGRYGGDALLEALFL